HYFASLIVHLGVKPALRPHIPRLHVSPEALGVDIITPPLVTFALDGHPERELAFPEPHSQKHRGNAHSMRGFGD
ncbi:MAG: hypothetical protein WCS33_05445, partial [Candidatus Caldatribacteriota bacterium]